MLERVIIAFENEKSGQHIAEILENEGYCDCILCRSSGEIRRLAGKQQISGIICGYKLSDGLMEDLFADLPAPASMLMVAKPNLLELCGNEDIFRLAAPVSRGDLLASVRLLLQMNRRLERMSRPRRSDADEAVVAQAKTLLMDCHGMTEEQAHRYLQKRSMDAGARMVQTAQLLLDSAMEL